MSVLNVSALCFKLRIYRHTAGQRCSRRRRCILHIAYNTLFNILVFSYGEGYMKGTSVYRLSDIIKLIINPATVASVIGIIYLQEILSFRNFCQNQSVGGRYEYADGDAYCRRFGRSGKHFKDDPKASAVLYSGN